MKRNPNGPIPGFEDEFTGTVGREKRVRKTHFSALGVTLRTTQDNEYEWVQVGPGRYKRVKKHGERNERSVDSL